ncbi:MAG TPA: transposase [Candidatus Acidoferrum sp.]|jgi:menaquinone-specific isochorismate synthase
MPTIRSRGKLPHWEADQAIYFVTFRLADSLPRSVLQEFEAERQNILAAAQHTGRATLSLSDERRLEELLSEKVQAKLDAGAGRCFLADPRIASVVAEALRHFNLTKYRMYAWCVMPNHVHALFRILEGNALAEILHAWKSFSATKANRLLRRSGAFWQREYYDHLVRSEDEFCRIVNYTAENPSRAGLRNWRWVGVDLK